MLNNKILSKSLCHDKKTISVFDFKKNSKKLKSENKAEAPSLSIRLKQTRASLFGMLFSKKTPIDNTIINELEDRFLLADVGYLNLRLPTILPVFLLIRFLPS